MSEFYGLTATLLVIAGSGHYLWQVFRRQVKPHFFSVLVWAVVTCIVAAGMLDKHIGSAGWRTFAQAMMLLVGALMSLRNGLGYIRRFDVAVLVLALMAIPVWIATKNPDASILWVLVVEIIGTLPAIRKTWITPHEEGVIGLSLNAVSYVFVILALNQYSFAVVTYCATWALVLMALVGIAVFRRGAPVQEAN